MVPMVGLAYWPLLVWLPLLALQCFAGTQLGRGAQSVVRGLAMIFVETPIAHFLKIVWAVMLVLSLDCLRGVLSASAAIGAMGPTADASKAFELAAAKEGALVLALNLAAMPAIYVIHSLTGEVARLERDRDMMRRQAENQGQFAKQLIAAESKKASSGVPEETKMPSAGAEAKESVRATAAASSSAEKDQD
mmetsp:Transcript_8954/g.16116  ORF Transcript_8954/g.16116 Transcript_8954/m.16116 type:complete len:192 (+) Transcript_8954:72-647(+)